MENIETKIHRDMDKKEKTKQITREFKEKQSNAMQRNI